MVEGPLRIYGIYLSRPVRTVAEFCKVNNIPFEHVPINPLAHEHKTPEFLEISWPGTIPGMSHGEVKLGESFAIIQYIAESYGINNNWWPTDPKEKALVCCYFHWHHSNTRNCTYLVSQKLLIRKVLGKEASPDKIAELEEKVKNTLDFVEGILATGKYSARTNEPSVADIAFYNEVHSIKNIEYNFEPYPQIRRLMDTIESQVPVEEINQLGDAAFQALVAG